MVIVGPGRRLPVFLLKAEHCGSWQAEGSVCEAAFMRLYPDEAKNAELDITAKFKVR